MTGRPSTITDVVAAAAASGFGGVARLRHRKPLHPRGLVLPAVVTRHGAASPVGSSWIDEPGRHDAVVRLSRSAGLPDGWPDVWGLALRVALAPSGVADLMLGGSFTGALGRHALALTRGPRAPLTCVLPYRTRTGRNVLLAAFTPPGTARGEQLPSRRDQLAARVAADPVELRLAVCEPWGPWRPFGSVRFGGPAEGSGDGGAYPEVDGSPEDLSFDPVLNPLPGLRLPEPLATVRARAYAGSRAGRRADPGGLCRTSSPR